MARYLWDSHVSAVVSDSPSVEVWPPDWSRESRPFGFLHRMLIGSFGMGLGELWWTADLADDCRQDGRHTMFISSGPLHVAGGISPAERAGLQIASVARPGSGPGHAAGSARAPSCGRDVADRVTTPESR